MGRSKGLCETRKEPGTAAVSPVLGLFLPRCSCCGHSTYDFLFCLFILSYLVLFYFNHFIEA